MQRRAMRSTRTAAKAQDEVAIMGSMVGPSRLCAAAVPDPVVALRVNRHGGAGTAHTAGRTTTLLIRQCV